MKKFLKRLSPVLLALSLLCPYVLSANALENTTDKSDTKNTIGTYFHEASGTLIVSGTGEIKDVYPRTTKNALADTVVKVDTEVKHLVIDEGITSISNSFNDMHNLQDILFPSTLKRIHSSFNDCDKIESLDFPSSLTTIGSACFNDCDGITDLHFNEKLEDINYTNATAPSFNGLDSIENLYLPQNTSLNGVFSDCAKLFTVFHANLLSRYSGCIKSPEIDGYLPSFINCADDATIYAREEEIDLFLEEESNVNKSNGVDALKWLSDIENSLNIVYLENLPNEIKVTNTAKGVELSWNCVRPGVTYYVYRNGTNLGSTRTGKFTDTTAESGKKYAYKISTRLFYVSGDSTIYLSQPELKSVVSSSSKSAKLKWNKVDGAKGYYIYCSNTGKAGTWSRIANIKSGDTLSYTATNLKKTNKYYFCVKPYSGKTVGVSSNKKAITVGSPVATAKLASDGKITVKWNKLSDVAYYRVYIKNNGEKSYTTVATIKKTSTISYSGNWNFDSQNTAYIRVRAFYKDGTHLITNPIKVSK